MALEQIDEGVLLLDGETFSPSGPRVVYCNRAAQRASGWGRSDLVGERLGRLFDDGRLEGVVARLPQVAELGRGFKFNADLMTADGGRVPCRWTVRGWLDGAGRPEEFLVTFRELPVGIPGAAGDEAARATSHGASSPSGREAPPGAADMEQQCKTETLAFIASGIAHDFNNVLTPIIANLSLARLDAPEGSQLRMRLDEVRQAADEARRLARQILAYAKGERSNKRPCDPGRLLREAARLATTGANVRCDVTIDEGLWTAEIDPTQITQVFNNLLINARQAMPDGGVIQARARNVEVALDSGIDGLKPGYYVEVTVRDRGCGIAPEDLESIFLAFFTTKESGSGIGLATCRSIVREHGGEITVRSKLQAGSEFRVYFPASSTACADVEGVSGVQEIIRGEGTVLVVDDQDSIREVAAEIIRKLGYDSVTARNGEDALQIYQDRQIEGRPISVVLLDMTLPGGMSGMDTLEELMKIDPRVRTIASSGYFDEDALESHRERGYVGILPKPYTVEHLSRAVHEALLA